MIADSGATQGGALWKSRATTRKTSLRDGFAAFLLDHQRFRIVHLFIERLN
jgi:hypothetical protein